MIDPKDERIFYLEKVVEDQKRKITFLQERMKTYFIEIANVNRACARKVRMINRFRGKK